MLMLRRSKEQIIAKMLQICQKPGVTRTYVVYQTNQNLKSVMAYLSLLIGWGLLEEIPDKSTTYKTTPKGKRALKALRAIEDMIAVRLE